MESYLSSKGEKKGTTLTSAHVVQELKFTGIVHSSTSLSSREGIATSSPRPTGASRGKSQTARRTLHTARSAPTPQDPLPPASRPRRPLCRPHRRTATLASGTRCRLPATPSPSPRTTRPRCASSRPLTLPSLSTTSLIPTPRASRAVCPLAYPRPRSSPPPGRCRRSPAARCSARTPF